jgi:hypothetical protein
MNLPWVSCKIWPSTDPQTGDGLDGQQINRLQLGFKDV